MLRCFQSGTPTQHPLISRTGTQRLSPGCTLLQDLVNYIACDGNALQREKRNMARLRLASSSPLSPIAGPQPSSYTHYALPLSILTRGLLYIGSWNRSMWVGPRQLWSCPFQGHNSELLIGHNGSQRRLCSNHQFPRSPRPQPQFSRPRQCPSLGPLLPEADRQEI